MNTSRLYKHYGRLILVVTGMLLTALSSFAQEDSFSYKPHDVIAVGNGLNIEILSNRGAANMAEYNVIFYKQIRQRGIRKWVQVKLLNELLLTKDVWNNADSNFIETSPTITFKDSIFNALTKIENAPVKIIKKPVDSTAKKIVKVDSIILPVQKQQGIDTNNLKPAELKTVVAPIVRVAQPPSAKIDSIVIPVQQRQGIDTNNLPSTELKPEDTIVQVAQTASAKVDSIVIPVQKLQGIDTNKPKPAELKPVVPIAKVAQTPSAIKEPLAAKTNEIPISNPNQNNYSLEQCFKIALENNNNIKRARNSINAAVIDNKTAKYGLLPSLSYDMGHYFSFGKNIDPVTNNFSFETFSGGSTALNLQFQLFAGFRKLNLIRQSQFAISSAEYEEKKAELELQTNITLTYARILMNNEEIGFKRNNISNTEKELEAIEEKIKVGRLTKYEYYAFNGLLNTQKAELVSLQNDSASARQTLRQLLNISFKQPIDIAPVDKQLLDEINSWEVSIETLGQKQVNTHPLVKQAEINKEMAKMQEKISKGLLLPSLSIGGNIVSNYNNSQFDNNNRKIPLTTQINNNLGQNINIGLRIPIFSQLQNINRVKKEKINVANAQLAIDEAKNTIYSNTLQLVNDFNTSKQRYLTTKTAFEQNKLSYDLYNEKYRLGQISSVELMAAQDILNVANSKYIQSKLQLFFQYKVLELLGKN